MHVGDSSSSAKVTHVGGQEKWRLSLPSWPADPLHGCHALAEIGSGHGAGEKVYRMCSMGSCGVPGTRIPLAGGCKQQSVSPQCVNLTSLCREVN